MLKKGVFFAALVVLSTASPGFAQFACPYSNEPTVYGLVFNPQTRCVMVLHGQPEMDVQASLAAFAFGVPVVASGSFTGDLGEVRSDPAVLPPVTSFPCTTLQVTSPRSQSHLHFVTRYAPGIHEVVATFTSCDAYYPQTWKATVVILVGAVTPGPVSCAPTLIDPVRFQLLRGSAITTDTDLIARSNAPAARGVAADGVARLVVRIAANQVGITVALNVVNDQGDVSGSPEEDGAVSALGEGRSQANSLGTITVDSPSGPMAFATFDAPTNFSRGPQDDGLAERSVSLRLTCSSQGETTVTETPVTITRPPVVLVHGLWADASTWDAFRPQQGPSQALWSRLAPFKVDYSSLVPGVTDSDPPFGFLTLRNVRRNSLGFDFNAPSVLQQVRDGIETFRTRYDVAAVSADVVAHSMGGLLSRTIAARQEFYSPDTYAHGPIHKLITIDTPHLGSPVATMLLSPINECVQTMFALGRMVPLASATIAGTTASGAVGDLRGDGVGGGLSPALNALPNPPPFPTAYIAGTTTADNLSGLHCVLCKAELLYAVCGLKYGNPLALSLTPTNWDSVFLQANDSIVPLASQTNFMSNASIFTGVIHSSGMKALNFNGPDVLDMVSGVPDKVLELLNEKIDGPHFQGRPR